MKGKRLVTYLAILLTICTPVASAQPPHYFTWYGSAGNQSLKTIHKITQDRIGYIWIATWDGLLMFDGHDFTRYSLPQDRMTNRFINVTVDCNDDIWAPAYDNRLYRFDRQDLTFEEIESGTVSESGYYISPDGKQIWRLGSTGRLTRIDIAPDRSYQTSDVPLPGGGAKATGVFFQKDGTMWILSDKGPIREGHPVLSTPILCAAESEGALFFGAPGGILYRHTESSDRQYRLPTRNGITAITPVPSRNEIMAATSESELFLLNLDSGTASRLNSGSLQTGGQVSIITDSSGQLWIHSNLGGIDWYDPDKGCLVPFFDDSVQQAWNSENRATAVFSDRQGILWVGTNWNGLMKVVFNEDHFFLKMPSDSKRGGVTPDNSVRALMEDKDGNIWASTKNGRVHIYDTMMSKIGELQSDGAVKPGQGKDFGSIYSISQSPDGTVWLGSRRDGLFKLSRTSERHYSIQHFPIDRDSYYGLNGKEIFSVAPDSSGRIWLATFDDGLSYLDTATEEFISKKNRLHFPTEHRNRLRFVTHTGNGRLYACGTLGIFICEDMSRAPEDLTFTNHILSSGETSQSNVKDVQHMTVTRDGTVYACTYGGGFYRFPDKVLGTKDGMMSDFTLASVQDRFGNIWIATDDGLNKYNPANGSIEGFSYERLGYKVRFNEGAPLLASDGNVYFNTSGGILHFDPSRISNSSYIPAINIRFHDQARPLVCTAGKDVSIDFQAMDMTDPERIIYYYRVDHGEWHNIGNARTLKLHSPRIGPHTLELRSTNGNGIDVENTVPVRILVKAPFYLSWWAIAVYMTSLFAIGGILIFKRWKRIQEEEPYYGRLRGADRAFVKGLVEYITAHIDETDLDVQRVANALNVSRSRLFEKSRAILGTSPAAIIRDIRFKRATDLIRGGEHSLSEVAYMSGFNDTHYFSTAFRQRFGITPGEYKKRL